MLTHRGWLPLCSSSWSSSQESRVLCRQLGYDVTSNPSITNYNRIVHVHFLHRTGMSQCFNIIHTALYIQQCKTHYNFQVQANQHIPLLQLISIFTVLEENKTFQSVTTTSIESGHHVLVTKFLSHVLHVS